MSAGRMAKWQRWLNTPPVRRAAIIAGKGAAGVVAAGAGLAIGLHETKRALGYEKPVDLWREVTVDVRPSAAGAVTSSSSSTAANEALVARVAKVGGFTIADFQAAARRLNPVELELEELADELSKTSGSEEQAINAVIERWRARGYIGEQGAPIIFGKRLTSDAQGADIGVVVPPYLIPQSGVPGVRPANWGPCGAAREAAVASLQKWGCTRLQGLVVAEDIVKLREALGAGNGANTRRAGEVGRWQLMRDQNVAMGRYTYGRLHSLLRGSPVFEAQAIATHTAVAPLVHAFFRNEVARGSDVFLSEAQVVVADPCAEAQKWHIDALGGPGLTVLVPFSKVTADRGPQAILPGSHRLHDHQLSMRERLRRCLTALAQTHGAAIASSTSIPEGVVASSGGSIGRSSWEAGDAIVLDGRTLHCGLANDNLGSPVPLLILRYDLKETPPPGCTRSRLLAMARVGGLLDFTFRLYASV